MLYCALLSHKQLFSFISRPYYNGRAIGATVLRLSVAVSRL